MIRSYVIDSRTLCGAEEICVENRGDLDGLSRRGFLSMAVGGLTVLAGGGLLAACSGTHSSKPTPSTGGKPRQGGVLRVGMIGGGQVEHLNPNIFAAKIDLPREGQIFEGLATVDPTLNKPVFLLAEEMIPNKDFSSWTIRLREGVTWHDGKDFTPEDVLYTIRNWLNPQNGAYSELGQFIDGKALRKVDKRTVELPLTLPIAFPWGQLATPPFVIVQDGETTFTHPAGTGPFKLKSFTPGRISTMTRNENYWMSGKPYLDGVNIVSFPDSTSLTNAFQGGQIDAMVDVPPAQARILQRGGGGHKLLISHQPGGAQFAMRVDVPPFDDPKFRQAMRLIADRKALIETVYLGFAGVSNDLPGAKGQVYYNDSLAQREQDLEQARSLLKSAGKDGATVTLHTTSAVAGYTEAATVLAQQAKRAGITINIKQETPSAYFDPTQLNGHLPFSLELDQPFSSLSSSYLITLNSNGFANSSHWKVPAFDKLLAKGLGEDPNGSHPIWDQMQEMLYNDGGLLTWCHPDYLDGLDTKVNGITPHMMGRLGNFNFRETWLAD